MLSRWHRVLQRQCLPKQGLSGGHGHDTAGTTIGTLACRATMLERFPCVSRILILTRDLRGLRMEIWY